ncbi:hypothetical protein [Candidatus Ferrigenium straubiae]|jgi:hypothetical protein|uniref:hypothetical protein n=1 Tax=Candidatus Ferrigenium straubiae TaxID=2919506 RepID=UPI003F4AA38C
MRYFQNPTDANKIYGYDSTDPSQEELLQAAIDADWLEVTGSWPPPPTTEQVIAGFTIDIQKRLDDFAKTRGYDGILSACTYATSLVPTFKAEGQYCVEARDNTWAVAYAIMNAVQSGQRPMPTKAEVIAELPNLIWPA